MNVLFGDHPRFSDIIIVLAVGIIGAGLVLIGANDAEWSLVEQVVVFAVAVDVLGGIPANASRSTNTWYKSAPPWIDTAFLAAHILQPITLITIVDWGNWGYAIGLYAFTIASAFAVKRLDGDDRQLMVAFGLVALGTVLFTSVFTTINALTWFAPAYLIKLVAAHAVDHYA